MAAGIVTAEHCKSWEKSGKNEFVKLCKQKAEPAILTSLGNSKIRQAIYEVCLHVVHGRLKQDHALNALVDLQEQLPELNSFVTDVLGLIDVELTATDDDKVSRERFTALVAAYGQATGSEAVLKSRLDLDLLENSSLVQSKQLFQQKYVKIKTRLYYKQQKFNLLREESEGYSKLITELNQEISEKLTPEQMLQNIKSLIGCFNLDPNRVIDILLESFEMRPELESYYVPLISSYIKDKVTLCHVLGFKFQFYKDEETPSTLYKLAALLLKNDLVELDNLYPHLYPTDTAIIDYHKKEMTDAKQYARKLLVVSLSDKGSDEKKNEDTVKIDLHYNNQKLGLVEALLGIGSWEKSKSILDRLPEFFGTTHRPIATSLCALIHTVLDPVYRKYSGLTSKIISKKNKHEMEGCNVEKATTFRDVYTLVFPMIAYLGPHAYCDPVLMIKLIRIGKTYLKLKNNLNLAPDDNIMYYGLLSILDEVILPSLSFLSYNCCISEELWGLMKLLPYELRYRMYGNWKNESYLHHPQLIRVRADTLERAKYIMKRLSKENVKPSGRQLGKLSHSNPGVLFEYVLKQIEKYDNLIGPVVDSLKYLTSFSYDILVFCIIEAVAGPEKDKMKFDDTSLSLWLQSLANFAGSICKKYNVELAGMMQYVTNQLKAGKSIDLLLMREIIQKMAGIEISVEITLLSADNLYKQFVPRSGSKLIDLLLMREIVQKMAGIEISEEITEDQLEAMSGGELLKQEGGYFSQVRNTKKSSTRLKDTVLEHDLALSLCLLISQQRDAVIYKEGTQRHLKLVGKLYDQCQDTLVQFGSFLSMQLSTEEFVRRLPPIDKMVSEYHVPADAAFFLSRSLYNYEINSKYEELRKAEKADKEKKISSAVKIQKYVEAAEMVMEPVVECVRPLQSAKIWEDLSQTFYVTFWSLGVYDINVPTASYEKQVSQLNNQITSIEDNNLPQSKKKKEKDRCNQLIDKLMDEEKKQNEHVQRVMARLKNEKDRWFVSRSTKNETITQFLQLCIFPRCCFTASDAFFCAKFIHILHNLKTPNFSTLICYDRIFCDITYTVSSCTENEAHRYGRFLCYALETVMRWHSSKQIYDKECGAYPGFVTVFRKGVDSNNKADQLDFENYRHVCHKWHFRITKAMVSCLESGNYIQIRNALIVLTKILSQYPRIIQFGQALERRIDRLRQDEKDKRPDVYALAIGYSGQLKSKKATWLPEMEFHHRDKDNKKGTLNGPLTSTGKSDGAGAKIKVVTSDKSAVRDKETKLKLKTEKVAKESKTEEKVRPIPTVTELKKQQSEGESRSSSKERKEKRDKEEKSREKTSGAEKTGDKTSNGERPIKKEKADTSTAKESSGERITEVKKVRVKIEPEEEKPAKGKTSRDHHDGKDEKDKSRQHREGREKPSREEMKADKHEKASKKEEKHERIKLKRSYSPERDDRDHYRERVDWEEARGSSVASNGSSHRSHNQPSPDESPRYPEERDMKRRKTDPAPSTSKEDASGSSKSRHRRSLSPDKDRERERKEKKRAKREATALSESEVSRHDSPYDDQEYAAERESSPVKKRRSLEPSTSSRSSKMNGDDRYHHEDGYVKSSGVKKEKKDGTPDTTHSRSKSKDDKKRDRSSGKRTKKE